MNKKSEDKCEECGYYVNYCDGYSSSCKDSKKEDLPILNVPPKYQPLKNVSLDRKDQKKYKNFDKNE